MDKKTIIIIVAIVLLICCCITGIAGTALWMGYATTNNPTTTTGNPTATPNGNIEDSFNSNANGWYEDSITDEYGLITRKISGGKYIWDFDAKKAVSKSSSPSGATKVADAEVSFDARVVSADAEVTYGIQFRYKDAKNYYILRISEAAKMYSLLVMKDGSYSNIIPWTADSNIKTTGNNLKVSYVGKDISIFINDVLIREAIDSSFSDGYYGINSEFYGINQEATVEFDNFKLIKK